MCITPQKDKVTLEKKVVEKIREFFSSGNRVPWPLHITLTVPFHDTFCKSSSLHGTFSKLVVFFFFFGITRRSMNKGIRIQEKITREDFTTLITMHYLQTCYPN